ncbi:MAG TPA: response regulator [Nitrospiria bacterium]|jgi:two-component system chemotaxis response regulator CheY|nr:response regulator [Nitrospiria bacterium]
MAKKILIIEDSATMRSLIASTIEEMSGFELVEASNGFEALKALPSQHFDMIITDLNMPDINGLEIIKFVKEHPAYKSIPLVVVTTEVGEEDRKKGLALGASDYVIKPFEPDDLKKMVRKILKH